MILKKLHLKNIRSYHNEVIDFPLGSVLLSGDIGSGKSTILLAVEFALFGPRRKSLPAESLLSHGAGEGSVTLSFSLGETEIRIFRTLKRVRGSVAQAAGWIEKDGETTDATHIELKTLILELLGYPLYQATKTKDIIFRYTVYTPQELMKEIVLDHGDLRLNTLRTVFGVDRYKNMRENVQLYSKTLKNRIATYYELSKGLDELNIQLSNIAGQISKIQHSLDVCMPRLFFIQECVQCIKDEVIYYKGQYEQGVQLKKQVAELMAKIQSSTAEMSHIEEDEKLLQKEIEIIRKDINNQDYSNVSVDKLQSEIKAREVQVQHLIQKRAALSEKIKAAAEQKVNANDHALKIAEFQKQIEELQSQQQTIGAIEEKSNKLRKEIEDDEVLIQNLQAEIAKTEAIIGSADLLKKKLNDLDNCPVCLQPVSSEHKHRVNMDQEKLIAVQILQKKDFKKKKDVLMAQLASKKVDMQKLQKSLSDHMLSKQRMEHIKELLKNSEEAAKLKDIILRDAEQARSELAQLRSVEEKNQVIMELRGRVEAVNSWNQKKLQIVEKKRQENILQQRQDQLKVLISEYEKQKSGFEQELDRNSYLDRLLPILEAKLSDIEKIEHKEEVFVSALSREKQGKHELFEEISKQFKQKTDAQTNANYLESARYWLDNKFVPLITVIEKQVLLQIYHEFNDVFKKWFSILIEDEGLIVRLADDFSPVIEQNGYETDISSLSGGERTSVALAYRLSLNKVVNDFIETIKTKDLIILDEPTEGFSSEQLDRMRNVLEELNTQQTIIVSHDSKMESYAEQVIRIEKTESGSIISDQ